MKRVAAAVQEKPETSLQVESPLNFFQTVQKLMDEMPADFQLEARPVGPEDTVRGLATDYIRRLGYARHRSNEILKERATAAGVRADVDIDLNNIPFELLSDAQDSKIIESIFWNAIRREYRIGINDDLELGYCINEKGQTVIATRPPLPDPLEMLLLGMVGPSDYRPRRR